MKKPKKVFIDGAISPTFIAESIGKHQSKTDIGAHQIFLGQVRQDEKDGRQVVAIEYEAHEEMAELAFHELREETFDKFDLSCMHLYHSRGRVNAGELCLFVFVSSKRRKMAIEACEYLVEGIKSRVPIFGKEVMNDASHEWKVNT